MPNTIGPIAISIKHGDAHINNSPFSVAVQSNINSISVGGSGIEKATDGVPAEFTVSLKDHKGANVHHKASSIVVDAKVEDGTVLKCSITERDGVYIGTYTPPNSGSVELNIYVEEKPVQGSPFRVQVDQVPDPAACTASGRGATKPITEKEKSDVFIHLKDKHQNPLKNSNGLTVDVSAGGKTVPHAIKV